MPAITISRVSTEDQKIQGNSLPAQEARMVEYCQRKGFEIVKKFSFDESAYGKKKRDDFAKVIEYIQKFKEPLKVVFDKVDRLSRDKFDKRVAWLYEQALKDKLELHFVSEYQIISSNISAVQKFDFGMRLGLANYFSDAISDNVKRANEGGRARGLVFTNLPQGYIGRSGNARLTDSSELITEAFNMFSTGNYTQTELCQYLNEKGFITTTGKKLTRQILFNILRNSFYYGVAKSSYGSYKHTYPTLTDYQTFKKVEAILDKNTKSSRKQKRVGKPYAFKNLLTCSECSRTINPYQAKKRYNYYRCFNKACSQYQKVVKEEILLKDAETILKGLVFPSEAINFIVNKLKDDLNKESLYQKQQRQNIYSEIETYQKRKSRLTDVYLDGSITKDDYTEKQKEIESKLLELSIDISKQNSESQEVHLTVEALFDLTKRLPEIFKSSNTEEKNQILRYITSNSLQTGNKAELYLKKPFIYLFKNQDMQAWHGWKESNPHQRFWRPPFYH